MKVAKSKKGMVVAAHELAAAAGREALEQGANAVEAAVAVSLALGVVEPFASSLGGGGYMMVAKRGMMSETVVLDGRGVLSSLAAEEYIYPNGVMLPWCPKTGPMSVAVPGLGRMLATALRKWGAAVPLARLAEPATRLAADGFEVGNVFAYCSALFEGTVRSSPECARTYYKNGARYKPGERLVQKDLARTLRTVGELGFDALYTGEIGRAMMATMNATGPVWGSEDLAGYEVVERRPLWADIAGHQVATNPPPSRGGAGIIQALLRWDEDRVRMAPTIRSIFHELHPLVGDPAKINVDLTRLVEPLDGPKTLDGLKTLDGPKTPPEQNGAALDESRRDAPAPGGGTTHFVVVDREGTIVSMSQTIGHFFGSGVVVEGYGIVMNDDVSDMERKPGHPNSIGPGKRSVSNMAPTIVFREGKPRLALGTPGSLRIFPAMAQVIGGVLFEEMDLEAAVRAGRIHWEENWYFFEGDIDDEVRERAKRELDQPVDERRKQDLFFGGVHGVEILEDGTIVGVADPRREGVAEGVMSEEP
jgi:gamma-glutamyltranspeptidase/glutathione hydrolase